jgi:hypothetical protein
VREKVENTDRTVTERPLAVVPIGQAAPITVREQVRRIETNVPSNLKGAIVKKKSALHDSIANKKFTSIKLQTRANVPSIPSLVEAASPSHAVVQHRPVGFRSNLTDAANTLVKPPDAGPSPIPSVYSGQPNTSKRGRDQQSTSLVERVSLNPRIDIKLLHTTKFTKTNPAEKSFDELE